MKLSIGAVVLVSALVTPLVSAAQEAEVSGNVGFVSEYLYRGIPQNSSSASAGLDLAAGLFSAGTWAADVGQGNEVDLYAAVGTEVDGFSVSIGGTGYFYTDDFDDTYLEGNLNAGYGVLSAEFSYGQYKATAGDQDYWFFAATIEQSGLYAKFGTFGKDFDGEYYEAGYGVSVGELDLSAAWIYSTEDLLGAGNETNFLAFGVSHTFDLN